MHGVVVGGWGGWVGVLVCGCVGGVCVCVCVGGGGYSYPLPKSYHA